MPLILLAFNLLAVAVGAAAATGSSASSPLDPDALSQRYRNWHYYPTWIIPPICLNPYTCATNQSQQVTDVFQLFQIPGEPAGQWRGVYLQYDGTGYETYMATTQDMVTFDLREPTLSPGQPGVIFSPRSGRPPLAGAKPVEGDFDFGGQTFIGPLLENYTVGAPAVLKGPARGSFGMRTGLTHHLAMKALLGRMGWPAQRTASTG